MDGVTGQAGDVPSDKQRAARAFLERKLPDMDVGVCEFFAPDLAPDAFVLVAFDDGWARVGRRVADGSWFWGGPPMPIPYWGRQ